MKFYLFSCDILIKFINSVTLRVNNTFREIYFIKIHACKLAYVFYPFIYKSCFSNPVSFRFVEIECNTLLV